MITSLLNIIPDGHHDKVIDIAVKSKRCWLTWSDSSKFKCLKHWHPNKTIRMIVCKAREQNVELIWKLRLWVWYVLLECSSGRQFNSDLKYWLTPMMNKSNSFIFKF